MIEKERVVCSKVEWFGCVKMFCLGSVCRVGGGWEAIYLRA